MNDIHPPGTFFVRGHLCSLGRSGEAMTIQSWPDLQAMRRHGLRDPWKPFEPGFRLILPRRRERPAAVPSFLPPADTAPRAQIEFEFAPATLVMPPTRAESSKRAFNRFRSACPREVARHTERFPSRHWQMLLLFRERIEAVELAAQNPALAFCLANRRRFRNARTGPPVAEISRRKQRDILGWLGFPDREGAARILAKIPPEAVHVRSMLRLRPALRDPAVCKLLAHAPTIHAGVLGLVSRRRYAAVVTPRLLAEVAAREAELSRPVTARMLRDVLAMARQVRQRDLPPAYFSIRRLREVHDEVYRLFARRGRDDVSSYRFPPPPLPGTDEIVPLCTPLDVVAEGIEQHHCVATYIPEVAAGQVFLYRVLRPERATLSVVPDPGGGWEIGQFLLRCNGDPGQSSWDSVASWLAAFSP